ncbi:hypothetical protein AcV7_004638 [Taiwanofungus camphoratus]|nr:hypothetical protein AcV7_004638 [Antrodia cinnamomea]
MFPRGPRFPAVKVPDIPGPNTYNPQDPEYDAYKRGAFLEKTNRFSKDKTSDVPGPGAYKTETAMTDVKCTTNNVTKSTTDRYAVLQRRVEELERLHSEGKKSHLIELERLKFDLHGAQKSLTEHSERADKQKKQNDALESRLQELKKISTSEQSEIRDLRAKIRVAEHERAQLASKQSEAGEARKALQAAEARRRDELRERDRKIAELEKALSMERKKRETVEMRLADIKNKADNELQEVRETASGFETALRDTRLEAQRAKAALEDLENRVTDREEELMQRLEQHRHLLARVADEYGQLVAATVPLSVHSHVKDESEILKIRVLRLERKLANTEGQVVELANLVRHTKDENMFLSTRLKEVDAEALFYSQALKDIAQEERPDPTANLALDEDLDVLRRQLQQCQTDMQKTLTADLRVWEELDRLRSDALILHSSALLKALNGAEDQGIQQAMQLSEVNAKHAELSATLEALKAEYASIQCRLVEVTGSFETSKIAEEALKKQLETYRAQTRAEVAAVEQTLQREREASKRLVETLHKSKLAEEALQAEIGQLSSELAQAERYQEAYNGLVEEVGALIARNSLAEEETARLSKFNAEILGHNNPAQRIMYVDRIRRELHETKQKLFLSTRDRDAVVADNDDLRYELELYKSVAVPPELKPRATLTRVGRVPLAMQDVNIRGNTNPAEHTESVQVSEGKQRMLDTMPELEYEHGEMTLDEIMPCIIFDFCHAGAIYPDLRPISPVCRLVRRGTD